MKLAAAKNPALSWAKMALSGEMARPLWEKVSVRLSRSRREPTMSPDFHLTEFAHVRNGEVYRCNKTVSEAQKCSWSNTRING